MDLRYIRNLYISLRLPTIFGPIYYTPPYKHIFLATSRRSAATNSALGHIVHTYMQILSLPMSSRAFSVDGLIGTRSARCCPTTIGCEIMYYTQLIRKIRGQITGLSSKKYSTRGRSITHTQLARRSVDESWSTAVRRSFIT